MTERGMRKDDKKTGPSHSHADKGGLAGAVLTEQHNNFRVAKVASLREEKRRWYISSGPCHSSAFPETHLDGELEVAHGLGHVGVRVLVQVRNLLILQGVGDLKGKGKGEKSA